MATEEEEPGLPAAAIQDTEARVAEARRATAEREEQERAALRAEEESARGEQQAKLQEEEIQTAAVEADEEKRRLEEKMKEMRRHSRIYRLNHTLSRSSNKRRKPMTLSAGGGQRRIGLPKQMTRMTRAR